MIKMIKPVVNASKIMDKYNTVILGLRGVITDGNGIKQDVVNTLINFKKQNIHTVIVSNTAQRVESVIRYLHTNQVPLATLDAIITAGELAHYQLKSKLNDFANIGTKYYRIGASSYHGVFNSLTDYQQVETLAQAEFLYTEGVEDKTDTIEKYIPILEHAASLNIPMVCIGNDTSTYLDGEICLGAGAIAEQYAVLGGRIITNGKPDVKVMAYAIDGLSNVKKDKVLVIGDSLPTDIKGARLLGVDSMLISKGIHVNFLGEGYIPDVAKTRELSANFDANPDYVISNLRW
ncbi:MAG: TIGR01459 family HAD-type hydrolase [Alphaproteobacteria bacterium]|nr:TIGR01459 family HAD-type hydrolase [Alphaproteobacteria bacterium]